VTFLAYETMVWQCSTIPKATRTCFKAILQIIRVGGISDNSRRKIIRLNLIAIAANVHAMNDLLVAVL